MLSRSTNLTITCLAALALATSGVAARAAAPHEIAAAARSGLSGLLAAIPATDLPHYGFEGPGDRASASLGEPFRVLTLTPAEVARAAAAGTAPTPGPLDTWLVPVSSGGRVRCLLTVAREGGSWHAVGIGSAGLAGQLDRAWRRWPASAGWQTAFVRVFQARSDLLFLTRDGRTEVAPLTSTAVALGVPSALEGGQLLRPEELARRLAPVVARELDAEVSDE